MCCGTRLAKSQLSCQLNRHIHKQFDSESHVIKVSSIKARACGGLQSGSLDTV